MLTVLTEFINAVRDSSSKVHPQTVRTEAGMDSESMLPTLTPYKDEVLGVLTVSLKTSSLRRLALIGLQGVVTIENFLTSEELGFIVHNVNEILEADSNEFGDARCVLLSGTIPYRWDVIYIVSLSVTSSSICFLR